MTKIAIAFFGLPRNSKLCYPSIIKNIYDSFPKNAVVKSFYHFYKQDKVVNKRSNENCILEKNNYEYFNWMEGITTIPDFEKIKKIVNLEKIKSYGDAWNDNFASFNNLLLQLFSLYNVTKLIEESNFNPDIVLFIRPDLLYKEKIPKHIFNNHFNKDKTIYIPFWQWYGGLNDRFAVCKGNSYKFYGERLNEILNFCKFHNNALHSESLLLYIVKKNKLRVKKIDTKAIRVRANNYFKEEIFTTDKKNMLSKENCYYYSKRLYYSQLFKNPFILIKRYVKKLLKNKK